MLREPDFTAPSHAFWGPNGQIPGFRGQIQGYGARSRVKEASSRVTRPDPGSRRAISRVRGPDPGSGGQDPGSGGSWYPGSGYLRPAGTTWQWRPHPRLDERGSATLLATPRCTERGHLTDHGGAPNGPAGGSHGRVVYGKLVDTNLPSGIKSVTDVINPSQMSLIRH